MESFRPLSISPKCTSHLGIGLVPLWWKSTTISSGLTPGSRTWKGNHFYQFGIGLPRANQLPGKGQHQASPSRSQLSFA